MQQQQLKKRLKQQDSMIGKANNPFLFFLVFESHLYVMQVRERGVDILFRHSYGVMKDFISIFSQDLRPDVGGATRAQLAHQPSQERAVGLRSSLSQRQPWRVSCLGRRPARWQQAAAPGLGSSLAAADRCLHTGAVCLCLS